MGDDIEYLFQKAYGFHVVDDKQHETIELCRKILQIDPNHHKARLLLGITLADYGSSEEVSESREHFLEAIKRAEKIQDIFVNTWEEEDPVYQLAISEWRNSNLCNAALFFLIDYLIASEDHSSKFLFEVLDELNIEVSSTIRLIVKRIKEEYLIIPKKELEKKE